MGCPLNLKRTEWLLPFVRHAAFSEVTWKMLLEGLSVNECSAWKAAHVVFQNVASTLIVCSLVGLIRECTLLLALRRESTLSRGPSRDCTPPDC